MFLNDTLASRFSLLRLVNVALDCGLYSLKLLLSVCELFLEGLNLVLQGLDVPRKLRLDCPLFRQGFFMRCLKLPDVLYVVLFLLCNLAVELLV